MLNLKTSADVYLEEADDLLDKGDIIQASEKYYKAAEEAIKILASVIGIDVTKDVKDKGWTGEAIDKAVFSLVSILGNWIIESWGAAISLITVNFDLQQIRKYRESIVRLVQVADERLNNKLAEGSR
ncbi:MAG: PaREP1 family protein [Sulfolobaceae archaeon]|nr:PaREP1 family protein [Sulfolobaceae archaeon]